ncbi:hypothetical protein U1Q18_001497 [Sarracenia purpurea var. burkii]
MGCASYFARRLGAFCNGRALYRLAVMGPFIFALVSAFVSKTLGIAFYIVAAFSLGSAAISYGAEVQFLESLWVLFCSFCVESCVAFGYWGYFVVFWEYRCADSVLRAWGYFLQTLSKFVLAACSILLSILIPMIRPVKSLLKHMQAFAQGRIMLANLMLADVATHKEA